MYFNHSLAGALAVKPIIDKFEDKFTEKEKTVLWFVGITASVLPDFDLAYAVLRNMESHRFFTTHGIFIYLVAFILLYALSFFQKKDVFGRKFFKVMSYVFLAGILTHFLIDIVVGGVAFFAPFSYDIVGFDIKNARAGTDRLSSYLMSPYMLLEFFIFSMFFIFIKGKKYIAPKVFALFYFMIAVSGFVFISVFFF